MTELLWFLSRRGGKVLAGPIRAAAKGYPSRCQAMKHYWWHRPRDGYFAVATDESGAIVSAWLQVGPHAWEPLDDFLPLQAADARGEIHRNPHGYTDQLGSSRGAVQ